MTVSQALGEITRALTQSPTHKYLFINDLEWLVSSRAKPVDRPAMLAGQFRIFRAEERPVGLALWAMLDAETEARFEPAGGRLRPEEWNKGDRCWLVELIAPYGGVDAMLDNLRKGALAGRQVKMHRTDADGVKVAEL